MDVRPLPGSCRQWATGVTQEIGDDEWERGDDRRGAHRWAEGRRARRGGERWAEMGGGMVRSIVFRRLLGSRWLRRYASVAPLGPPRSWRTRHCGLDGSRRRAFSGAGGGGWRIGTAARHAILWYGRVMVVAAIAGQRLAAWPAEGACGWSSAIIISRRLCPSSSGPRRCLAPLLRRRRRRWRRRPGPQARLPLPRCPLNPPPRCRLPPAWARCLLTLPPRCRRLGLPRSLPQLLRPRGASR